jgi:uncharacterized protein YggL (DUF469 family)
MNKRIRKKLHRGEYSEWGRQIVIAINRTDGFDAFVDVFLTEAIEANGCYCSAVGRDDSLHVVVELGRPSDDRAGRLRAITAWLDGRTDVKHWQVSEEFDLWHGDIPEG